jgi:hypothetical protein
VVEFLLGRYCASTDPAEIEAGLQIVEKQLQGRTVRTGDNDRSGAGLGLPMLIALVGGLLDCNTRGSSIVVGSLANRARCCGPGGCRVRPFMVTSVLLVRRHQWQGGQCTRFGSRSVVHWSLSNSVLAAQAVITTIHPRWKGRPPP